MARTVRAKARDVTFEGVRHRINEFGERATLISVNSDGRPQTVSVDVHLIGERLVVAVLAHLAQYSKVFDRSKF